MQNFIKQIISAIKFWVTEKINEKTTSINTEISSINTTIDSINTEIESMNQSFDEQLKNSTADWARHDETQMSYIQNRTHYDNTTLSPIFDEQVVEGFIETEEPIWYPSANEQNIETFLIVDKPTIPLYVTSINTNTKPEKNKQYVVTWDGVSYTLNCNYYYSTTTGIIYLGNENYISMLPGGDVPFTIIITSTSVYLATESTDTSHTISISEKITELHKLDNKYLNIWGDVSEEINVIFDETLSVPEGSVEIENFMSAMLEVGDTYKILFNDIEYECIAKRNEDNDVYIGCQDLSDEWIFNETIKSSEPFFIATYSLTNWSVFRVAESGSYVIKILHIKKFDCTNQINKTYIPNTSDWNQNEAKESGYIQNRTHWAEYAKIVDDQVVIKYDIYAKIYPTTSLIAGKTYRVLFNNNEYICTARAWNDGGENAILIGNGTIYGDGDIGNNEPFSCDYYDINTMYLNTASEGAYSLVIYDTEETVHQLDEKYIPDSIARADDIVQSDWNQNDENQLNFIKNKPFYKVENPNPVLFEGDVTMETFTSEDGSSYIAAKIPNFFVDNIMNSGDVYKITINETIFENQGFLYSTDTNKYCWFDDMFTVSYMIEYDLEINYYMFGAANAIEGDIYSLKIEDTREYIHKFLDEEFLPEKLGRSVPNIDSWIFGANNSNQVNGGHLSLISGDGHTLKNVSRSIVTGYGNKVETRMGDAVLAGNSNEIDGDYVSVFGNHLIGHNANQHLTGEYNLEDTTGSHYIKGKYVHIVGNGTKDARSNAHTLDWSGNAEYQGDVKANACGGENPISLIETYNAINEINKAFIPVNITTIEEFTALEPALYYTENYQVLHTEDRDGDEIAIGVRGLFRVESQYSGAYKAYYMYDSCESLWYSVEDAVFNKPESLDTANGILENLKTTEKDNLVSSINELYDNKANKSDVIQSPTTASIGQVLSVKSVDENNTPTEWEAIDPSSFDEIYIGNGEMPDGYKIQINPNEDSDEFIDQYAREQILTLGGNIPTKTSQLTNDSNYQTNTEVQSAITTALEGLDVSGGGSEWKLITNLTLEEDVKSIEILTDDEGNNFECKELLIYGKVLKNTEGSKYLRINIEDNNVAKGISYSAILNTTDKYFKINIALIDKAIHYIQGFYSNNEFGASMLGSYGNSYTPYSVSVDTITRITLLVTDSTASLIAGSNITIYGR